jgi:hypothetical protein
MEDKASRTSSSLNGLMIAVTNFMLIPLEVYKKSRKGLGLRPLS